jgi:molecular chaperone HscB
VTINADHFSLFGLAPAFALDLARLDAAYKEVMARVHPDRFAAGSAAERRVAMQWAARANEAHRTLRDDGRRAAHLCEMQGVAIDAETNTAMPPEFLMQQMQWREALDEMPPPGPARAEAMTALQAQVDALRSDVVARLSQALDQAHDFVTAAALVRQLMFIDRFRAELPVHHADTAHGD